MIIEVYSKTIKIRFSILQGVFVVRLVHKTACICFFRLKFTIYQLSLVQFKNVARRLLTALQGSSRLYLNQKFHRLKFCRLTEAPKGFNVSVKSNQDMNISLCPFLIDERAALDKKSRFFDENQFYGTILRI